MAENRWHHFERSSKISDEQTLILETARPRSNIRLSESVLTARKEAAVPSDMEIAASSRKTVSAAYIHKILGLCLYHR